MSGQGMSYGFLSEEKVTGELHEVYAEVGLVVVPTSMQILETREDTTRNGGIMHNVRLLVGYTLIDPDDGDEVNGQAIGEGSDTGDKAVNKAMTAAYKYFLRQSAMISSGDDPDNHESHETVQQTPVSRSQEVRGGTNTAQEGNYTTRDIMNRLKDMGLLEDDGKGGSKPSMEAFKTVAGLAGVTKGKWSEFSQAQLGAVVNGLDIMARGAEEGPYQPPAADDVDNPFADQ